VFGAGPGQRLAFVLQGGTAGSPVGTGPRSSARPPRPDQLIDPAFGFTPDARLDMAGFRNMLALRAEVEGKPGAPPERYLDLGYYERAMAMVGR